MSGFSGQPERSWNPEVPVTREAETTAIMGRSGRTGAARNLAESGKIVPLNRPLKRKRMTTLRHPSALLPALGAEELTPVLPTSLPPVVEPPPPPAPAAPLAIPGGRPAPRHPLRAPEERAKIAAPGPELAILHDPDGTAATQFRVLRYRIEADRGCQVIAVTGAERAQGASSLALNTALALAEGGRQRVALVDLDLRHGSASRMVGLADATGVTELLLQRRAGGVGPVPTVPVHGTMSLLPSGIQPALCAEMVGSLELADLLDEMRGRFDYIVLDVPSILDFSDASLVHASVDRFILCARKGSDGDRLRRAMTRIPRAKVLGAVLVEASAP